MEYKSFSLTMTAVREDYWIPRLRSLVKAVRRKDCNGCHRFQAVPMQVPAPGNLPTDRTSPGGAFEVIGMATYGCGRVACPEQSNLNYSPTYPPKNSCKHSRSSQLDEDGLVSSTRITGEHSSQQTNGCAT